MNTFKMNYAIGIVTLSVLAVVALPTTVHAESYKCKGADGKIEYSDRACDTSKESLSKPKVDAVSGPASVPMKQVETLVADYEPGLCERERIASELDAALRSGDLKATPGRWKLRQERLVELNDKQIEFQDKARKITKGMPTDSPELMAVRNFQRKLKTCGVLKK
ncbi:MAG: DUF4124 domain-containing protein [Usitatibacteraceae bacterium]